MWVILGWQGLIYHLFSDQGTEWGGEELSVAYAPQDSNKGLSQVSVWSLTCVTYIFYSEILNNVKLLKKKFSKVEFKLFWTKYLHRKNSVYYVQHEIQNIKYYAKKTDYHNTVKPV